ncbi:hypothetical protein, partial [Saccharopolyspora sp. 5N708]|uniref:hypothetical protein n=1 Tax=Saccharopolyspora sp. 5N708 TaxID=3457424 RepID=UPI003FD6AADA
PGTRNPEPGTRNPEPGTRNPEPGTRNPEPGTRNPEPGTRNPEGGPDRADHWDTVRVQRRVLGVVRTLTALDRLLDVLPALADDMRVETRFAVAEGSKFASQLTDHLHRCEAQVADWHDATGENFDFAISPSGNGPLHELDVAVLTMSHGAGPHKFRAVETGFTQEISGLSRTQLMHEGRVVPAVVGLSHVDHFETLRRSCPEAVPRAEVIGDPCFARLRASLPMRELYRKAIGTGPRKLVVLASTWGPQSLYGRHGDLAKQLVSALPAADYQVALILHPNIWDKYKRLQLEGWTQTARRNGLILVPPLRKWQAALVAADVVISDHGSLAFYAATLGKPLLLAAFGSDEVVSRSPMATLGERAPRLDPNTAVRPQIDSAKPINGHQELAASAFQDQAYPRLRKVIYDQLGLPEPPWPARPEPVELFTP